MSKKTITMKNVAELACVSSMTVSRVLNNEPNVSKRSKEAVLKAIQTLGYTTNIQAKSLASGKKFKIGLFYDDPKCYYMSEVLITLFMGAQDKGYQLVVDSFSHENIKQALEKKSLDGVILVPPFCEFKEIINLLNTYQIPFVRLAAGFEYSNTHCIRTNDKQMAFEMTKYLIKSGHRKIGYIRGHTNQGCSYLREEGFIDAIEQSGMQVDTSYCEQGFFTSSSAYSATKKILDRHPDTTAIFACSDIMVQGVMKYLKEINLSVPQDISVAGYDNLAISRYMTPLLTTVNQPSDEMAEAAIDLLIEIIKGNIKNKFVTKHFESKLMIRQSVRSIEI